MQLRIRPWMAAAALAVGLLGMGPAPAAAQTQPGFYTQVTFANPGFIDPRPGPGDAVFGRTSVERHLQFTDAVGTELTVAGKAVADASGISLGAYAEDKGSGINGAIAFAQVGTAFSAAGAGPGPINASFELDGALISSQISNGSESRVVFQAAYTIPGVAPGSPLLYFSVDALPDGRRSLYYQALGLPEFRSSNWSGSGRFDFQIPAGTTWLDFALTAGADSKHPLDLARADFIHTATLNFAPEAGSTVTLGTGQVITGDAPVSAVPEPASLALMLPGLGAVALLKRKKAAA